MKKDPKDGANATKHYKRWRARMVTLGEQLQRELPGVIDAWPLSLSPLWRAYWKPLESAMDTLSHEQLEAGVPFDAWLNFLARSGLAGLYLQNASAAELTTKRVRECRRRPDASRVAELVERGLAQARRLPEKRGINPVTTLENSDLTMAVRELDGGVAYVSPSDWMYKNADALGKLSDRMRALAETPRVPQARRAQRSGTPSETAYRDRYGEAESEPGADDCFHLNIIAHLRRIARTDPDQLPSRRELELSLKRCAIKGGDRDAVLAAYEAL